MPRQAVCDTLTMPDGVELRYARWPPNRSPVRGTVVILQGRTEFIEKYFETVNDLRRRGFAVATYDARGQGGSSRLLRDRHKGHVRDFADHVNDLDTFLQEVVLPDCPPPYFVLAHSTGANVALLAAERVSSQVERMVLTAPLVALRSASPKVLARTTGLLMHFGLGEMYVPGHGPRLIQDQPFENNPVTTDPTRFARPAAVVEADPSLGVGGATVGWLNAAMRASCRMAEAEFPETVNLPVLIVLAGSDQIVSNQMTEALSGRLKMAAHLRIPGARHEILMESNVVRDQFWVAFDAFVKGRT